MRACRAAVRPQFPIMTRVLPLLFLILAGPAHGWEFTPHPVCTLRHDGAEAEVAVTFDPHQAEPYAIALTRRGAAWPDGPVFTLTFQGPRPLTIGTDRHRIDQGGTLTVTDRGFGNVLNGLEFGDRAVARLADASVDVDLTGAAEPVARFRACAVAPMS